MADPRNTLIAAFEKSEDFVGSPDLIADVALEALGFDESENDPMTPNWTVDPATGRSNSSPLFEILAAEIAEIIRGEAAMLIRGDSHGVARLILAQLAHEHNFGPLHEGKK